MSTQCHDGSHVWTVETRSPRLHPGLDLIPGRQCQCGQKIVFEHLNDPAPIDAYDVEPIDGPAVRKFEKDNPNLVTWK